jgi:hypothetical protein
MVENQLKKFDSFEQLAMLTIRTVNRTLRYTFAV